MKNDTIQYVTIQYVAAQWFGPSNQISIIAIFKAQDKGHGRSSTYSELLQRETTRCRHKLDNSKRRLNIVRNNLSSKLLHLKKCDVIYKNRISYLNVRNVIIESV